MWSTRIRFLVTLEMKRRWIKRLYCTYIPTPRFADWVEKVSVVRKFLWGNFWGKSLLQNVSFTIYNYNLQSYNYRWRGVWAGVHHGIIVELGRLYWPAAGTDCDRFQSLVVRMAKWLRVYAGPLFRILGCNILPYSGKFSRGRNFRDFRDQTPAPKISCWQLVKHSIFEPQIK